MLAINKWYVYFLKWKEETVQENQVNQHMSNFLAQVTKSQVLQDIPVANREMDRYNSSMPQKGHLGEFRQRLSWKKFYVHQMQS